jgi:acyl-CoA thioester hydrolase
LILEPDAYIERGSLVKDYLFQIELGVRGYECDMSGIVYNAVNLNYLEYDRHKFLKSKGVSFAEWVQRRIHLVVIRIEIYYLVPLVYQLLAWI